MKKTFVFLLTIIFAAVSFITVSATESNALTETEFETDVDGGVETVGDTVIEGTTVEETAEALETTEISETTWAAETTEPSEATKADESTEALIEIRDDMSFSEIVFAIADAFGISVEEAEKMVANIRELGDRYLSDSDLWGQIAADMDAHPAKWTLIGLMAALILFLIGLLIKRVISDATAISRLKVAVAGIDRALSGDGQGDGQDELSVRALIRASNEQLETFKGEHGEQLEQIKTEHHAQIEQLKGENVALAAKVEEQTQAVQSLIEVIRKTAANSDTSLKLTEESTLRIMQLLKLTLDRDIPKTSKEARALWYSATQSRIKEIYEEGVTNAENGAGNGQAEEAGQKV